MNSENIKELIQLFGTLGASSKEAFLWFIILDFSKFLIAILLGLTAIIMAYRLIRKGIRSENQEEGLKKLRDDARLGSGWLSDYDIKNVLEHYSKKK